MCIYTLSKNNVTHEVHLLASSDLFCCTPTILLNFSPAPSSPLLLCEEWDDSEREQLSLRVVSVPPILYHIIVMGGTGSVLSRLICIPVGIPDYYPAVSSCKPKTAG